MRSLSKHRSPTFFKCSQPAADLTTIEVSDTSADETDDNSSDKSFSSQRSHHRFYPKDVVMPEVFDGNGKQTLKKFLEGYERYFRSKYVSLEVT